MYTLHVFQGFFKVLQEVKMAYAENVNTAIDQKYVKSYFLNWLISTKHFTTGGCRVEDLGRPFSIRFIFHSGLYLKRI